MNGDKTISISRISSFRGRFSRRLFSLCAVISWGSMAAAGKWLNYSYEGGQNDFTFAGLNVMAIGSWLGITATIKRLHDLGKSGWWLLVPIVLECFLSDFLRYPIVIPIAVLILACMPGQQGPNKYE